MIATRIDLLRKNLAHETFKLGSWDFSPSARADAAFEYYMNHSILTAKEAANVSGKLLDKKLAEVIRKIYAL